ncbi:MAG: DinB family protein [Flavitalea sp.]
MSDSNTERWMAGPVENVPPLLQPVAHALLQADKEIHELMNGLPEGKMWDKLNEMASVGFHLQHIKGFLDRLFTYARAETLSEEQFTYLKNEGVPTDEDVLKAMHEQVLQSVSALADFDETRLTEFRGVGRKQLPSTVIGLLFHSAEHMMRHTGQLHVTVRCLRK